MNEVKPTNVAMVPAGSVSPQAGTAGKTSAVPGGKDLPPARAPQVEQPKVDGVEAYEEQQNKLEEAVSKLNDYVQSTQRDLQFSYDEGAGRQVVTVLDRETQQVIRRIPDEVVLNLARKLNDEEPVRLFTAQA